jgi:hypothetical protein
VAAVAARPTPGSADLCLIVPTARRRDRASRGSRSVEQGPCTRTGALGPIESVVRDPDGNWSSFRYVDD